MLSLPLSGFDRASENLGDAHCGHTASMVWPRWYYGCAKMLGAAPCRLLAGRGERLSFPGIPGACRTLDMIPHCKIEP